MKASFQKQLKGQGVLEEQIKQILGRNRELEKENAPYQELLASFSEKENDYLN